MTVDEVKKFAKENYGNELTDAEAEAILGECVKEGELDDAELGQVSGGISGRVGETLSEVFNKLNEQAKKRP